MGSGWHPLSSASSWPTPPRSITAPNYAFLWQRAPRGLADNGLRPPAVWARTHSSSSFAPARGEGIVQVAAPGNMCSRTPPGTHTPLSFPRRVRVVWELRHSCSPPAGRHRVPRGWAGACASELSTDADASAYCTVHMRRECACAARRANRWQRPATYIHTRACPFVALFVLPPSPRPPPQQQQQQ